MLATLIVAVVPAAPLPFSHPEPQSVQITAVVDSGALAPGTTEMFRFFGAPTINNRGEVAFTATITGSTLFDQGLWSEGPGTLTLIAREGLTAPGLGGTFDTVALRGAILNDQGQVSFSASTASGIGIWKASTSTPLLTAGVGLTSPGLPAGVTFQTLGEEPALTNAGQVGFPATHSDGNAGIWLENTSGSLVLIAVEGGTAPGAAGVTYADLDGPGVVGGPVFSTLGDAAFEAPIQGPGVGIDDNVIVAGNIGAGFSILFQEGVAASGTGGETFEGFPGSPSIASGGTVVTQADITGAGATNSGIWKANSTGNVLVARRGSAAPGTTETFQSFTFVPRVNAEGLVAFTAQVSGSLSVNEGLWVGPDEASLQLMVREGDAVPGAPGLTFAQINDSILRVSLTLNDVGQVALLTDLSDGTRALVATALDGTLLVVVREGTTFQGKNISQVNFGDLSSKLYSDRGQTPLNDFGTLGIQLEFSTPVFAQSVLTATIVEAACPPGTMLCTDVDAISLFLGGTQTLSLDASAFPNLIYWVLGSVTGTTPGFPFLGMAMPLNFDAYTSLTLTKPNLPPFANTLGTLSPSGSATATVSFPPGFNADLAGVTAHHAFAVIDPVLQATVAVSNPAPMTLVP